MIKDPVVRTRLEQIRARFDKATPGPWEHYGVGKADAGGIAVINDGDAVIEDPNMSMDDTVFVANIWSDVKFLLSQIEGIHDRAATVSELALGAVMAAKAALDGEGDPDEASGVLDSVIDELMASDPNSSNDEDEDEDEDEEEEDSEDDEDEPCPVCGEDADSCACDEEDEEDDEEDSDEEEDDEDDDDDT